MKQLIAILLLSSCASDYDYIKNHHPKDKVLIYVEHVHPDGTFNQYCRHNLDRTGMMDLGNILQDDFNSKKQ